MQHVQRRFQRREEFRHPDHFENYDQWPFFWGQNEGTIAGNCAYLNFAQALKALAK